MKVSLPQDTIMSSKKELLPLVPESELETLDSSNSVRFELKTVPSAADSATYRKHIRILTGSESVRTIVTWYKDIGTVITGLHLQDDNAGAKNRAALMRTVMSGTPKSLFETKLTAEMTTARADEARRLGGIAEANLAGSGAAEFARANALPLDDSMTVDHLKNSLCHVLDNVIPSKALQRIKRSLRRRMRKPNDMNVRQYVQHLIRINNEELPFLPPFRTTNSLSPDEMVDIFLFGTPKSWQIEMERQGFDPLMKTQAEVAAFMEQIESAEAFDSVGNAGNKSQKNDKDSGKKKSKHTNSNKGSGGKYCAIHGKSGHSTEDCRTIQRLKDKEDGGGKPAASKNKSWNRPKDDDKKDIADLVKKQVKRELNALTEAKSKKRAQSEVNNCEEDDDLSISKMDFNEFGIDGNNSVSSVDTEISLWKPGQDEEIFALDSDKSTHNNTNSKQLSDDNSYENSLDDVLNSPPIALENETFSIAQLVRGQLKPFTNKANNDMIIRRDMLDDREIDIQFSDHPIIWDGHDMPLTDMTTKAEIMAEAFHISIVNVVKSMTDRATGSMTKNYHHTSPGEAIDEEIQNLYEVGVLQRVDRPPCTVPTLIIPCQGIEHLTHPRPNIQVHRSSLEGLTYETTFDLSMAYDHLKLDAEFNISPLPQGLYISPDIFQGRMSEVLDGFEHVRTYIDDLFISH